MVETVFHDSPRMVAIIECESKFTHYHGSGVLRGRIDPRDTGVAQINTYYHPGVDVENIWTNLAYARRLYAQEGVQPWVCDSLVAMR